MVFGLALLLATVSQAVAGISPSFHSSSAIVPRSAEISAEAAREEINAALPEAPEVPEARDAKIDGPLLPYLPGDFVPIPVAAAPAASSSPEPIGPRSKPLPLPEAPKPAFRAGLETPAKRHAWYALAITAHGAAAFDAWSTRRVVSSGAGTEANPLLRPFSHSGAIYAATQVSPAVMDFFGRRMKRSSHPWVRKTWWLPQSVGAAVSFAAAAHNVRIVK